MVIIRRRGNRPRRTTPGPSARRRTGASGTRAGACWATRGRCRRPNDINNSNNNDNNTDNNVCMYVCIYIYIYTHMYVPGRAPHEAEVLGAHAVGVRGTDELHEVVA